MQNKDEFLTLPKAALESGGKISYQQLLRACKTGRITAYQPAGRHGHHRVRRGDLEALIAPVTATRQK